MAFEAVYGEKDTQMTSKSTYTRRRAAAKLGFVYVKPGVYPAAVAAMIETWRIAAEAALAEATADHNQQR